MAARTMCTGDIPGLLAVLVVNLDQLIVFCLTGCQSVLVLKQTREKHETDPTLYKQTRILFRLDPALLSFLILAIMGIFS